MMATNWRLLTIVMACLAVALTAATAAPAPMPIARAGKASCRVAVAADATATERTAARELAEYLNKVTGATFSVGRPSAVTGGAVIAVGPGAAKAVAPDLDLNKKTLGEDGIVLKTVGKHLVLTGAEGSRRGTLYAVYEFLERVVGVRWWTHTEESVPSKPDLKVGALNTRYKPPFLYREVFSWGMVPDERQWGYDDSDAAALDWAQAKFAARLRNNGHGTSMPASLGGCYMPLGWCHTFYPFLPPAKYFRDHPEWYSEINGKRVGEGAQLCMANDEMLAEFSRNALAAIRKQPQLGMVVVTMNDWGGNCQCAKCRAMDEAEGSAMGSLLYGVNKIAAEVEKEFPETLIATHAYIYARKPPQTIRPRDNVLIWLCVIERSATQPIDSDANRKLMEDLQGWAKAAHRLFIWDYTMNLPGPMAAHPNWPVFGPDFRNYRDHNAIGVFCEGESVSVNDFVALKVYAMAHLLWDPARDERQIVDEFLGGYYGKAAPALRQLMDLVAGRGSKVHLNWYEGPDADWLDLLAMNRATELLQQAEAAVAGDPIALVRVRRAGLAIQHQWLRGYASYRDAAARGGLPFLGPADPSEAAARFAGAVKADAATWTPGFMTRSVPASMGTSLDSYLDELAKEAGAAAKDAGPLPAVFGGIPRDRIIDVSESLASVFTHAGASVVADPKAANGLAMRVPKAPAPSWAVQAKTKRFGLLGGFGRYHVYAVVRCELQTDTGLAFVGGVWDDWNRKGLGAVSFPIGKPAPPPRPEEVDANPEIRFATIQSGAPVTDGEYHLYDFGTHDLPHGGICVWVGTTTGDMFVDRFVFVREP